MDTENALDEDFRNTLSCMKLETHILPSKSEERRNVTQWIKVLLELRTIKKERSTYARQLLEMLKRGNLEDPFNAPPPPHWYPLSPIAFPISTTETPKTITPLHLTTHTPSILTPHKSPSLPLHKSPSTTSSFKGADVGRHLLLQRELELSLRTTETTHQEEKLILQRQHEDSVQELLQRKRREMEEVRRQHSTQLELLCTEKKELEMTVAQLLSAQGAKEDSSISTHTVSPLRDQTKAEFDRKLHRTIADFEQQKLEMEQRHSKHAQTIVSDCNRRISRMEEQCAAQISASSALVAELEGRVEELSQQICSLSEQLSMERVSSKKKHHSLMEQLQTSKTELIQLTQEITVLRKVKEKEQIIHAEKMDSVLREKEEEISKLQNEVTDKQLQLSLWQRRGEEMKGRHRREMTDVRESLQQQLRDSNLHYQQKLSSLEKEHQNRQCRADERVSKMQHSLRLNENRLAVVLKSREVQTKEAEETIEHFKAQVKQRSQDLFSSLQSKVTLLEQELRQCREEGKRQGIQFETQAQQQTEKLSDMVAQHKEEIETLNSQHQTESTAEKRKLEKAKSEATQLHQKLSELQTHSKAASFRASKTISSLEQNIQKQQKEYETERSRQSKEGVRRRRRAEEEKEMMKKLQELAVSKLMAQWEEEAKKLKQMHQKELTATRNKHNQQLQCTEQEHETRVAHMSETITSLQTQVAFLQDDITKKLTSHKSELSQLSKQKSDEQHQHTMMLQSIRQEADASQYLATQLQERLVQLNEDYEAKLSSARLQSECALKGMLPAAIKKEYEDTISSLKAQAVLLEQRRVLLQHQLQ